jgi:deoxyribodipyrimidine photo-lyase
MVPDSRVRGVNAAPLRPDRPMVLYWMVAARRTADNYGLERAVGRARELRKPLVILEALRADHPWAAERFHQFVLDGMHDTRAALAGQPGVTYFPYVETGAREGRGLLETLAADAAAVVTDDFPCFFLPRMVAAAGARLDVRLEAVDSNGLLPIRTFDRAFSTAHAFRRAWQQVLAIHLAARPESNPLARPLSAPAWAVPDRIARRWPDVFTWLNGGRRISDLPIDRTVRPTAARGGGRAARERLGAFLAEDLPAYGTRRNDPDRDTSSRLSPYLHWGHLGPHEVFDRLMAHEGWLGHLPARATGSREGWWSVSAAAESFLDEFLTWRELGYNMTANRPGDYDRFASLPAWAQETLEQHAEDPREPRYDLDAFERGGTHDALWNAAQRQLLAEGRIHNYLRMLWGKKILHWSASPREALDVMIHLNNRYALDGRNPNSYSGIGWVLGRYDRPWAPARPIFGVVRYMSSESTARKLNVKRYLERYGPVAAPRAGDERLF